MGHHRQEPNTAAYWVFLFNLVERLEIDVVMAIHPG